MAKKVNIDNQNAGQLLTMAFDKVLEQKYSASTAPPAYVTPTGIRHLDALLGGGISSSLPVAISSTPETGKSTFAFQFAASFQRNHEHSVVVYLDIENAASSDHEQSNEDRISTFEIDTKTFMYKPVILNIKETFTLISELTEYKRKFEERTGKPVEILFIWDSLASTGSSKDISADNPNEIIGFKARELTFELNKIKPILAINKISLLVIDQVRSNLKIDSPFARAEKTVGDFGNFKSATSITSLQHNIKQWLFLSKGKALSPVDTLRVDGWIMHAFTEKNKLVPSNYWVDLVFDKKFGIVPILSEYYFLSNLTKTERKVYKTKKTPFVLPIDGKGYKTLEVIDPTSGSVLYTSDKFRESKFIEKYNSDETFRGWFDKALEISINERIISGYFRSNIHELEISEAQEPPQTDDILDTTIHETSPSDTVDYKSEVNINQPQETYTPIPTPETSSGVGRTEIVYD